MISVNLALLRKQKNMTQEEVAEKINVSRQAVAQWEKGKSVPDIYNCAALAELFGVTVDDLINYSEKEYGISVPPKGKYFFGTVTVGERGQIVIPKKARQVFNIDSGGRLLVFGDAERGLALLPERFAMEVLKLMSSEGFNEK